MKPYHKDDIVSAQRKIIERQSADLQNAKAKMLVLLSGREKSLKKAKIEAIKEFAERVRELTKKTAFADCWSEGGFLDSIDNLVKEMTEESQ